MEDHIACDRRKEMKSEYSGLGAGAFDDHRLLELLLFYSSVRENTELLAKELLEKFGSLDNLLNADIQQIALFKGLEEDAAQLIKLAADIGRRAVSDKENLRNAKSIKEAKEYFKRLLENEPNENFAAILLDGGNKVKFSGIISEGSVSTANIAMMKLTQLVLDHGAQTVIIAHNHPNGLAVPSKADIDTTDSIRDFMKQLNAELIDHIIIGSNDIYSMRSDPKCSGHFE